MEFLILIKKISEFLMWEAVVYGIFNICPGFRLFEFNELAFFNA